MMKQPMERGADGVIRGRCYRFTLLASQLIRMEYDPDGLFEDRQTQAVVCRTFEPPKYRAFQTEDGIEVQTDALTIYYDEQPFSPNGLWIENRSACAGIYCTWHYGDKLDENLGGTARTLDEADGAIPLENGVLSRLQGYALIDDSSSFIRLDNGSFEARRQGVRDLYFFGYGFDYVQALRDFFRLCGATPLLPRFALGNWWSRFYAYSDHEYLELMDRFERSEIPLSVAVLDMDWHITEPSEGGKGWTGYTWNRRLFADPASFLAELHQRGLMVTLNVHPAEGVQAHEEMYAAVADALGRDWQRRQRIPFDATNPAFLDAYFAYLHHPREAEGVDFWWIDWQQGKTSAAKGLDPLWVLNEHHTKDIARSGRRPMILSRYAGVGSHRYPVGFSGDSVISWKTLAFQPYFTATASNAGYGWWSHDIGGHTHGRRDDELQVRWLQFGVFSPILRMHSTNNRYNGKEPWRYPEPIRGTMTYFLRLRHRLVPYLYTMNWRCHAQGRLLIEPMYYRYPAQDEAYRVPNQYFFGSELIVSPITQPIDPETQLAETTCWIPEGTFYDVFTGERYAGDQTLKLARPLHQIPVLAAAGAIVPLASEKDALHNGVALPRELDVWAFAGDDGMFSLYEDDGISNEYQRGAYGFTTFALAWKAEKTLTIQADKYVSRLMPRRSYRICLMGVCECDARIFDEQGNEIPSQAQYDAERHIMRLTLHDVDTSRRCTIHYSSAVRLAENDVLERCDRILNNAQIEYETKQKIYTILSDSHRSPLPRLLSLSLPVPLLDALAEQLSQTSGSLP